MPGGGRYNQAETLRRNGIENPAALDTDGDGKLSQAEIAVGLNAKYKGEL